MKKFRVLIFLSKFTAITGTLFLLFGLKHFVSAWEEFSIFFPNLLRLDSIENRLVISEIMLNPLGSEPGNEWVEIYNRSQDQIDLFGYKLGDSETIGDLEGMYVFPKGAKIQPGEIILVANQSVLFTNIFGFQPDFELADSDPEVADLLKYQHWAGGVINFRNDGDEAILLNPDDKPVDILSWGDSNFAFNPSAPKPEDGMSLERNPADVDTNNASDWSILSEPEPGQVNVDSPTAVPSTPTATQVSCDGLTILISEVLYDPVISPDPSGEWLEIFNYGGADIDLTCVLIGDEETMGGSEGMMKFPSGSIIQAGQVIVIAMEADDFINGYGFSPDFEIKDTDETVPKLVSYTQWGSGVISLSNSGDEILLVTISAERVDEVSWENSNYAFNPPVPGVDPGHSISRQPADLDTDSADDWVELIVPQPGVVILDPPASTASPETEVPTQKPPTKAPPTKTPTQTPTSTPTKTPEPEIKIVINEILADPDPDIGDANNDGSVHYSDDEFVEIINNSSSILDISGWSIGDMLDIRHTFPSGTFLNPGCGVIIFGGGSPNGGFGNFLVQVASSGKLGLNDNMEIVYIYDSNIEVVKTLSYGEEAGDNQSITRDPDIIGPVPLRKHTLATGANGAMYSPGNMISGSIFSGCSE